MTKNDKDLTVQTPATTASNGLLPADVANLSKFIDGGFSQESAFWIGNPEDGKVGIYFGELIAEGEPVVVEKMGGKPDPVTGEIPTSEIPCFLFHPLNPTTFEPANSRTDNVICNAAVASACRRYSKLAVAAGPGAKAQILFRWKGFGKSRKGFPFNDIETLHRILKADGSIVSAGSGRG